MLFADLPEGPLTVVLAMLLALAGLTGGWWFTRPRRARLLEEYERAREAVERIRSLADSVAENVEEHSGRVRRLNADLSESRHAASNADSHEKIVLALSEIERANERLKQQLDEAKRMLHEQARAIESYAADARTDSLTGLANRRAFDAEMKRRYAEWQRLHTPFSLLLIDVDYFKRLNDSHGHPAGDEVLRGLAKVLAGVMREMDLVCRYGGEEFAVILPATDLENAKRAAARAHRAIGAARFKVQGSHLNVTASIGLARIAANEDTASLVARADEALYAAKAGGRNCVFVQDGERALPVEDRPTTGGFSGNSGPAAEPAGVERRIG